MMQDGLGARHLLEDPAAGFVCGARRRLQRLRHLQHRPRCGVGLAHRSWATSSCPVGRCDLPSVWAAGQPRPGPWRAFAGAPRGGCCRMHSTSLQSSGPWRGPWATRAPGERRRQRSSPSPRAPWACRPLSRCLCRRQARPRGRGRPALQPGAVRSGSRSQAGVQPRAGGAGSRSSPQRRSSGCGCAACTSCSPGSWAARGRTHGTW
mmetsp:Transcript_10748/g.33500  ORF Transcript_10748/g.33500 Transcript_10748/m.33500 type:complete len:207 (-) Transcript_10748:90-710(-)